jgi:excisionase family DNA binding protein
MDKPSMTFDKLTEKYGISMTVGQVAEVLKLANDTVLGILRRKEIPARKFGKKWVIATETVAVYITTPEPEKKKPWKREKGQKLITQISC